jgi:Sulfotransferase domain
VAGPATAAHVCGLLVTGHRPYLLEAAAALWPGDPAPSVLRGGAAGQDRTLVAVPGAGSPRLLLPRSRAAAAEAVRAFGGRHSRRSRLRTEAAAGLFALGLGGVLFRDRVRIGGAEENIVDRLTELMGEPVHVALHGGPPRANRKPVLAVLDRSGRILGFAKVGTNALTRELLATEASALTRLSDLDHVVRVPRLLHHGTWRDMTLLVQEALPTARARRVDDALLLRAVATTAGACGISTGPWGRSEHAALVRARLVRMPGKPATAALAEAVDILAEDPQELSLGCWHGDWTPWNSASKDGSVLLWDWERFGTGVPVGFDLLHHDLQAGLALDLTSARASALLARAPERLAPLGLTPVQAARTAVAYLIELASRYLVDDQAGAGARVGNVERWLLPALTTAVRELDRPRRDESMSRIAVPDPVYTAVRASSRAYGRVTANRRMLPTFLISGAQRCGTTSMYKTLTTHPQVLPAVLHKGVHYFDTNYGRGLNWYRAHFPTQATADRTARAVGGRVITGESSPYYMFHPLSGRRIVDDLPDPRMIILLRDPVERAYSAFTHESARGYETETFERALELEESRLAGEEERMTADPTYVSFDHQHHAYVRRGMYVHQLERLEKEVGRDRLLVIDSGDLFTDPAPVFEQVCDFLGLAPWQPAAFDQHNARPRSGMDEGIRQQLTRRFEDADERLAAWLGRTPSWRR